MTSALKAKHEHDCEQCTLVGTMQFESSAVDVYVHKHETFVEYVYRYGSNGPDYIARMAENPQPDATYLAQLAD